MAEVFTINGLTYKTIDDQPGEVRLVATEGLKRPVRPVHQIVGL